MNNQEAIRILEENKPTVIFEDEDAQKRMADIWNALNKAIFALTALDEIRNETQYLLPPTNVDLKYYDGYVDARNQIVEIIDKYTKGEGE